MNLKNAFLLTLVFMTIDSFGQEKIDNSISITFPGKPKVQDLSENNISVKALYLNSDKESFITLRTAFLENGTELNKPAINKAELDQIYNQDLKTQIISMGKKGFSLSDSTRINLKSYVVYKLKYNVVNTKEQGAESIILFLNGIRYVITYSKVSTFNEDNKNQFLNSISIGNSDSLLQIAQTTNTRIDIFKYSLYAIIAIGLVIYFRIASKKKSKHGINLNAVYCPKCNTKQPIIRMPTNASQALYGGTTCPKCMTNLDKYGNIIT